MSIKKPNHICKNKFCTKGTDGSRKHYYACDYCTRTQNWRSVACSFECWLEYQNQVIEARSKGNPVDLLPDRTDMDKNEIKELMNKPVETVIAETKEELNDYKDENDSIDFSKAVENINLQLEKKNRNRPKKKNIVSTT